MSNLSYQFISQKKQNLSEFFNVIPLWSCLKAGYVSMNSKLYSFQEQTPQTCLDICTVNYCLRHTRLLIKEIANATTGGWIN